MNTEFLLGERPKIVCLCGSTRFVNEWKKVYRDESLAGNIVLSVGVMIHAGDEPIPDNSPLKAELDVLHLHKIDLADEVVVIAPGGYIGESTRGEISYAEGMSKPIRFADCGSTGEG